MVPRKSTFLSYQQRASFLTQKPPKLSLRPCPESPPVMRALRSGVTPKQCTAPACSTPYPQRHSPPRPRSKATTLPSPVPVRQRLPRSVSSPQKIASVDYVLITLVSQLPEPPRKSNTLSSLSAAPVTTFPVDQLTAKKLIAPLWTAPDLTTWLVLMSKIVNFPSRCPAVSTILFVYRSSL